MHRALHISMISSWPYGVFIKIFALLPIYDTKPWKDVLLDIKQLNQRHCHCHCRLRHGWYCSLTFVIYLYIYIYIFIVSIQILNPILRFRDLANNDYVKTWKHSFHHRCFVRESTRRRWIPPPPPPPPPPHTHTHKRSVINTALIFSFFREWIRCGTNRPFASGLGCHNAHVMSR